MRTFIALAGVACLLLAADAHAQTLKGQALIKALRQGGYVIVMRHAISPLQPPDKAVANPDNVKLERQLDQAGRATAEALGQAWRTLKIPIGEVYSSPTYRALETVRYAELGDARTFSELGDNGQSMQGGTLAQTAWLKKQVRQFPQGVNTVIVTHLPNLTAAFPLWATGMADGEALILGPDGTGGAIAVARVKIDQWSNFK